MLTLNSERSLKTQTILRGHHQSRTRSLHSRFQFSIMAYQGHNITDFVSKIRVERRKVTNFYLFIFFFTRNSEMLVCLFTSQTIYADQV